MSGSNASGNADQAVRRFLAEPLKLLIDGNWVAAESGETLAVIDPSTGQEFVRIAAAGSADVDKAVRAARQAFDDGRWCSMPILKRQACLQKLADIIEAHVDELALLESLDIGSPLERTRAAVGAVNFDNLRYLAGWIGKIGGEVFDTSQPDQHAFSVMEPIGVVGAIIPWNAPMRSVVNKAAPALTAGCTMVIKPAEVGSLTPLRFGEMVREAGIPDGVINIVTGLGSVAGQALVEHPLVDKITFTGSTGTGKAIARAASGTMKRLSLELGGKSPIFIFPDADIERAISFATLGIFHNAGQVCIANSRLYAHESVFDQVVEGIARNAEAMKIGGGQEPGVQMGPVVSQQQLDRVTGLIESGRKDGARVVTGGERIDRPGYFIQPTILADTSPNMSVMREEIFGPVLCATRMGGDDLDEIARTANDTEYGLAAYIWTRDLGVAHKLSRKIRAGWVRVNGGGSVEHNVPFGGYKQSGMGRERGLAGVKAFMEQKSILMDV